MVRKLRKVRRITEAAIRAGTRCCSTDEQGGFVKTPSTEASGAGDSTDSEDESREGNDTGDSSDDDDGGATFNLAKRKYVKAADRPGRCRGFYIARVVQYTDKVGDPKQPPDYVDLDEDTNEDFKIKLGDFVLVLSPPTTLRVNVRNYSGQEGRLPQRMLQDCYNPWSIPVNIRLDDNNGIPFPLRFTKSAFTVAEGDGTAFEEDEPVMIMRTSQNPAVREVVDFERNPGSILQTKLRKRYAVPWNLMVDRDALESRYGLRSSRNPRRSKAVIGRKAFGEIAAAERVAILAEREAARLEERRRRRKRGRSPRVTITGRHER